MSERLDKIEDMPRLRKHPKLYDSAEAASYLHLDSESSLETVRRNFGLVGYPGAGKGLLYWEEDLDATALRIVGRGQPVAKHGRGMRLAK